MNTKLKFAARRFKAVDPDNRLVARQLEVEWEEALHKLSSVKEEYENFKMSKPLQFGLLEQNAVANLAKDIPKLWNSKHTSNEDKKRIVRALVEKITVVSTDTSEYLSAEIHWYGGSKTSYELRRPVNTYKKLENYSSFVSED